MISTVEATAGQDIQSMFDAAMTILHDRQVPDEQVMFITVFRGSEVHVVLHSLDALKLISTKAERKEERGNITYTVRIGDISFMHTDFRRLCEPSVVEEVEL